MDVVLRVDEEDEDKNKIYFDIYVLYMFIYTYKSRIILYNIMICLGK